MIHSNGKQSLALEIQWEELFHKKNPFKPNLQALHMLAVDAVLIKTRRLAINDIRDFSAIFPRETTKLISKAREYDKTDYD